MHLLALLACLSLCACSETVLHGLTEDDANEVLVLLDAQGIPATRNRDPDQPDRWTIDVTHDRAPSTRRVLLTSGLPRRTQPTLSTPPSSSSLLQNPEHDRWTLRVQHAQRLETSLRTMNGVLQARVHLIQPHTPRPLLHSPTTHKTHTRASVVLVVQPNLNPPPNPDTIAQWVASSVEHLSPKDVHVLIQPRILPTLTPIDSPSLDTIGPWSVAQGQATSLRATLAVLLVIIMGLCAAIFALILKLRRTRTSVTTPPEDS